MMPQEIGIAAAYEAYRQIKYSTNVYQSLYTDYERQREAMFAVAIAEGMSLSCLFNPFVSHNPRGDDLIKPSACGTTLGVH